MALKSQCKCILLRLNRSAAYKIFCLVQVVVLIFIHTEWYKLHGILQVCGTIDMTAFIALLSVDCVSFDF